MKQQAKPTRRAAKKNNLGAAGTPSSPVDAVSESSHTPPANGISDSSQTEDILRLFDNHPVPMWVSDPKTLAFLTVNKAMLGMYGYSRDEFLKMTIEDIHLQKDIPRLQKAMRHKKPDTHYSGLWSHRRKDGTVIEVEVTAQIVMHEGHQAALVVTKDVTGQIRVEEALRRSEEKYRALVENINDVHFAIDAQGLFTYISPVIERFAHYRADEIIGQPFTRFIHPDDLPIVGASFERTLTGNLEPSEFRIYARDGAVLHVRTSSRPNSEAGQLVGLTGVMVDITDRKLVEEALQKTHAELEQRVEERTVDLAQANRVLNILSACNQAVVRATDEAALLQEICQIIVDLGGYPLVWVGFAENDAAKTVRPVAQAGYEEGYLNSVNITWADDEHGQGPTGKAIRLGEPFIAGDTQTDPDFTPWRGEATRRGYASSIALPLRANDWVFGALNIYAPVPDAFQEEEVFLLMELAGDLAFGITSLRERSAHNRTEESLKESEMRYRAIVEAFDGLIYICSQDYRIEFMNKQLIARTGYDGTGELCYKVLHDRDSICPWCVNDRVLTGEIVRWELQSPKDDRWYYIVNTPIYHNDGTMSKQAMIQDITERKRAEESLWESSQMLKLVLDNMPAFVFWKDLNSVYLGCNNLFAENAGLSSPEEIIGLTDLDLPWKNTEAEGYRADDRMVMETGIPKLNYEETQLTADGHITDVRTSKIPLRNPEGDIIGVLGTFEDITERKQADRVRKTLYEISQAVISTDKLEDLYRSIHSILGTMMPVDNFFIALYDQSSGLISYPYYVDQFDTIPAPGKPERGLTEYVLRSGRALLASPEVFNALVEQNEVELIGSPSIDWLGAPLRGENRIIGVMAVQSYTDRVRYGTKELHIMEFVSTQVAMAIERKRSFEEIRQHLQRLNALRAIDMALTSSFDLRSNLNTLLEQVLAQLAVHAADVLLLDPYTLTLEYAAGRGFRTRAVEAAHIRLGENFAGRVALERRAVQLDDSVLIKESPQFAALWADERFAAYYAVPLITKGQVKGVMEIFHRAPLVMDHDRISFLETLAGQAAIGIENAHLFEHLQRSNVDLALAYDATIEGWSKALDLRDMETEGHTLRVTEMTMQLARAAGMTDEELVHVRRGALLHDIGKMGIPDSILLKPGPLTDEEWDIMRRHPKYAYEMLSPIVYLRASLDIPYCHHEKWDGTGYPRGLKGEQIPLAARLFAVIDVYDALISRRPYRDAWSREKTIEYIKSLASNYFDPKVVRLFLEKMRSSTF